MLTSRIRPGPARVWTARLPVQRRTFLGLQRTPAPKPHIQGLLVGQGLAVVLLIDYAAAALQDSKTITRSTLQFFGLWQDPEPFETSHKAETPSSRA